MALADLRHLIDIFDLVAAYFEYALALLVRGQVIEHIQRTGAHIGERVLQIVVVRARRHFLHRQHHATHHRIKKIGLVLEMPVNRPPRDASGFGKLRQRCVGNTLFHEYLLGTIQYPVARFECLLLRSSHHCASSRCVNGWPYYPSQNYQQVCTLHTLLYVSKLRRLLV